MEGTSGRSLERFFERWIYGSELPRVAFGYRLVTADGVQQALLRFEQEGHVFDLPVTVVLQYADGRTVNVPVALTERIAELRTQVDGPLRGIGISRNDGTLAEFSRTP
jgi:aminopeptidase N